MFFRKLWLVVCIAALTIPVQAQNAPPSEHENNLESFQELHEKKVAVDFFETRFEDVLAQLKEETGISFVIDESASDNSIDEETLITLKLSETRVATALKFMLNEFSCTWSIQDGVVVINSQDASLDIENFGLIAFNCDDLISKIEPLVTTHREWHPGFGPGGGIAPVVGSRGGGVFSVPVKLQEESTEDSADDNEVANEESKDQPQPPTPVTWEETVSGRDQLIDTITEMVDPDSWESNGGNGRITALNNVILVSQTQENLRAITELLDQLRTVDLQVKKRK